MAFLSWWHYGDIKQADHLHAQWDLKEDILFSPLFQLCWHKYKCLFELWDKIPNTKGSVGSCSVTQKTHWIPTFQQILKCSHKPSPNLQMLFLILTLVLSDHFLQKQIKVCVEILVHLFQMYVTYLTWSQQGAGLEKMCCFRSLNS